MDAPLYTPEGCGLYVQDVFERPCFGQPFRVHTMDTTLTTVHRIIQAFVSSPHTLPGELVDAAMGMCGADSAGLCVEQPGAPDDRFYHWLAAAGEYASLAGVRLPRYPSACGLCLERNKPLSFRVGREFLDILGIVKPIVTDGILVPWKSGATRGTLFVMAHGRDLAFDAQDCRVMMELASFAAIAYQHLRQQKSLLEQAALAAAASMANELAHEINNPLQGLTNLLFLANDGFYGEDGKRLANHASDGTMRLTSLVQKMLSPRHAPAPPHKAAGPSA